MSIWRNAIGATLLCAVAGAWAQPSFPGIGRAATPQELAAWDTDVRPDFRGLPAGSGSVERGMQVWEGKCASCHGVFGESNEVFSPIVGGTTAADIASGRVARLTDPSFPGRTTLMKLSTLSTLWDYIRRAMPWTAPKSLSTDEVYAVTAYILNMGGVLPDNFVLSDRNIAEVQQRLPNRNGTTTAHALWPGRGFGSSQPDVQARACMRDCAGAPKIESSLPAHARNAHGNLALQNRSVGAQRGIDTTQPPGAARAVAAAAPAGPAAPADPARSAALALASKHGCVACHGMDSKVVGPGFSQIAQKHAGRADLAAYLAGKITGGSSGVWGAIAMPAQPLAGEDAQLLAQWLAQGAGR